MNRGKWMCVHCCDWISSTDIWRRQSNVCCSISIFRLPPFSVHPSLFRLKRTFIIRSLVSRHTHTHSNEMPWHSPESRINNRTKREREKEKEKTVYFFIFFLEIISRNVIKLILQRFVFVIDAIVVVTIEDSHIDWKLCHLHARSCVWLCGTKFTWLCCAKLSLLPT